MTISDEQLYCQWFDANGNGPAITIDPHEEHGPMLSATRLDVDAMVTAIDAAVAIHGDGLGGLVMRPLAARQLAARLSAAADLAEVLEAEPGCPTFIRRRVGGCRK
jgi:hypothetical protein